MNPKERPRASISVPSAWCAPAVSDQGNPARSASTPPLSSHSMERPEVSLDSIEAGFQEFLVPELITNRKAKPLQCPRRAPNRCLGPKTPQSAPGARLSRFR